MTVGERIREQREKMNMSQVDFADKIEVSKQTLYKYENNLITNIPSDKIEAVAKLCHVSPSYLMGWSDCEDGDGEYEVYIDIEASSKEEAIHKGVKAMLTISGENERAETITQEEALEFYSLLGFKVIEPQKNPTTIAAHKDGDNFTPEELDKIEEYKKLLIAARPKE